MSKMLNLDEVGWQLARSSAKQGRRAEAIDRVTRFLARPGLTAKIAAEACRLAGELLIDNQQYAKARRYLSKAAEMEAERAETYYLWGIAYERDPEGCDLRASRKFRRAFELDQTNPGYRAAYGRAAMRCGAVKRGSRLLLEAARDAAGDLEVVRVVIEGLVEAGRFSAARGVFNRSRFFFPGNRELESLNHRISFEAARHRQRLRGGRGTTRYRHGAEFATEGGRVVLPFVRTTACSGAASGKSIVRHDVVSFPKPHFPRLMARKADR